MQSFEQIIPGGFHYVTREERSMPKLTVSRQKPDLAYFTYPAFDELPFLLHAFTTRAGGVSKGCFASLNLCMTRGDDPEDVMENHRIMAAELGYDLNLCVHSHQTHTTNVRRIFRKDGGLGITRPQELSDVDGMITNEPGVVLMTFYADCTPLYFVDPVHKAIGLAHAGWRGTIGRIGAKTVEAMQEAFGTKAEDLLFAIGPSICPDCYEISEELAEDFRKAFPEHPEILKPSDQPEKAYLNLWECNRITALESGILPEHISVTNVCTRCNSHLLYSHRVQGNDRGNLTAILGIRE